MLAALKNMTVINNIRIQPFWASWLP